MSFNWYIRTVTIALVSVGFMATLLIEEVGWGFKAGCLFATVITGYLFVKRPPKFSHLLWNIIAVIIFAVFISDYILLSKDLIASGSKFLMVLVALKLLDVNTRRDFLLLFTIIIFEVLAAAASTVSPLFFAVLCLFIITSIWAMMIFNLKRDHEEWSKQSSSEVTLPKSLFGAPFIAVTGGITIASVLITFILFMIIPRMSVGFFNIKSLDTIKTTAFSDTVKLGELGTIKLDPTIVMRIELPESSELVRKKRPLHMKGATLDTYDDINWKRTLFKREKVTRTRMSVFEHLGRKNRDAIRQDIMLEPVNSTVLFALPDWNRIEGGFIRLFNDRGDAIRVPTVPYRKTKYSVWSTPDGIIEDTLNEQDMMAYLALPEKTELIMALAKEVTTNMTEDIDKARAIEAHLKGNYGYSLTTKKGEGETPLNDFLFYTKQGYCEQYATAMAIMLRTIDIPSRLVTGYLEGQWNPFGDYYVVRQQDAHSWVEAYIKDLGWVTFDPTANSGLINAFSYSKLTMYMDTLIWRWNRHIINYSFEDQVSGTKGIESRISALIKTIKSFSSDIKTNSKKRGNLLLIVLLIPITAVMVIFYINRSKKRKHPDKTPLFYLKMLAVIKKDNGMERLDHETPRAFAERTGIMEVTELTDIFEKIRYGNKGLEYKSDTIPGLMEKLLINKAKPA
ncbi:MAG: DUF3488 domain-containing protein [Deltaproteobacteria bacterium]|nr:DUF3488 domain-containing protein [Deltaproteobacteria bacterium]